MRGRVSRAAAAEGPRAPPSRRALLVARTDDAHYQGGGDRDQDRAEDRRPEGVHVQSQGESRLRADADDRSDGGDRPDGEHRPVQPAGPHLPPAHPPEAGGAGDEEADAGDDGARRPQRPAPAPGEPGFDRQTPRLFEISALAQQGTQELVRQIGQYLAEKKQLAAAEANQQTDAAPQISETNDYSVLQPE